MRDVYLTAAALITVALVVYWLTRAVWAVLTRPKLLTGIAMGLLFLAFLASTVTHAADLTPEPENMFVWPWSTLVMLACIVVVVLMWSDDRAIVSGQRKRISELEYALQETAPTITCLRDITHIAMQNVDSDNMLMIRFTTYAHLGDFASWLRDRAQAARR